MKLRVLPGRRSIKERVWTRFKEVFEDRMKAWDEISGLIDISYLKSVREKGDDLRKRAAVVGAMLLFYSLPAAMGKHSVCVKDDMPHVMRCSYYDGKIRRSDSVVLYFSDGKLVARREGNVVKFVDKKSGKFTTAGEFASDM